MDWRNIAGAKGLAALMAVLVIAGCNSTATPSQRGDELAARARALEAEVTKAGKLNASQQQAFDRLVADVTAYNTSTKRADITVERGAFSTGGGQPAYSARMLQPENPTCTVNCPLFPPNRPEGYFCLPDGGHFCDPITGVQVCSYKCVKIPFTRAAQ